MRRNTLVAHDAVRYGSWYSTSLHMNVMDTVCSKLHSPPPRDIADPYALSGFGLVVMTNETPRER